jgi:hypothetical protein
MDYPKKATRLEELAAQLTIEPLRSGDPRYVDLTAGRGSQDLRRMALHLRDFDASENRFANVAFTGHRGSGKSTELYRLEHDLSDSFFPVHLFIDDSLLRDCDYTDLMLWLVDALARRFSEQGMPLDAGLVEKVVDWFAERTFHKVEAVKKEIELTAQVEGEAKTGVYWASLKLLARLKSSLIGSVDRRKEVHSVLQRYASELVAQVNLLLDNAASVLGRNERPANVLIVQDNLDRLQPEVARRLFFDNGDVLKSLRAHVIYTVPVALVLAPWRISIVFEGHFSMPVIKVRNQKGRPFSQGIEAVLELLAARMDLGNIFTQLKVARDLAIASGGSMRDLMRLLNWAQLAARGAGKDRIDAASAREAVKVLRIDFEKVLIPGSVYYPLLAQIHTSKRDWFPEELDAEKVEAARELFDELLFNGSVLEYNGETNRYDVHPIVQQTSGFEGALKKISEQDDGADDNP